MVFARLRLRVTGGLQENTNYLFVHPYGERTIKTDPGDRVTSASLVEAAAEEETEESPAG